VRSSSRADFAADHKWRDYLNSAIASTSRSSRFPGLLPEDAGRCPRRLVRREGALQPINGNRRRSLILGVALTASRRLARVADPELPW
jgi:hypothetical protein